MCGSKDTTAALLCQDSFYSRNTTILVGRTASCRPQQRSLMTSLSPSAMAVRRGVLARCCVIAVSLLWTQLRHTTAWTTATGATSHRGFLAPRRYSSNGQQHAVGRSSFSPIARRRASANSGRLQRVCRASGRPTTSVASAVMDALSDVGYVVDSEVGRCKLEALPALKNKYYALRHGQSVANMEGVISSDPEIGAVSHGLTSNGRAQARASATALIELVGRDHLDSLVFVASDFLRARQTAEECRAALQNIVSFERQAAAGENGDGGGATPSEGVGNQVEWLGDGESGGYDVCPPVVIRQELRERFFGELDGTILVNYNKVWPEDLKDGKQEGYGVESVCDVAGRVGRLVRSLEQEYEDAAIVFSSHADTLQIAQCHIARADERLFSQYRFRNGEVRSLLQDPGTLPLPKPLSFQ